jgi:RNA polymerase sigma-B factor
VTASVHDLASAASRQRRSRGKLNETSVDELQREYHRTRDPQLLEELVVRRQLLAHSIAARFCNHVHDREDRDQVAMLGLLHAIERFDPDRGVSFSTYAWATITGELKRFHRSSAWAPHVARSLQELHLRVAGAIQDLVAQHGRPPTVAEIAAQTGDSEEAVIEGIELNHARSAMSLDAPAVGRRPDWEPSTGVDGLSWVDDKLGVESLLALLSPRTREIVRLRFAAELSQSQIAAQVGLSQMHVSRLLARALQTMREAAESAPPES